MTKENANENSGDSFSEHNTPTDIDRDSQDKDTVTKRVQGIW